MFPLLPLEQEQWEWCLYTISSNAFYMLVGDALSRRTPLSVVRMADGERSLLEQCERAIKASMPTSLVRQPGQEKEEWKKQFGIDGITAIELRNRLLSAIKMCTYYAPSLSGVHMENFRMYQYAQHSTRYVDNFFPNAWDNQMKIDLYRKAGHVLFIHANRNMADALQIRCKFALGVKVTYLSLTKWEESEEVITQAESIDAPLVIFSGGPASKYIGPIIATNGNIPKVTLDIGQAAERWLLPHLKDLPQVTGRYVELI